MASAWVERRETRKSGTRHVVRYRIGGRESALRFGGSFLTQREAKVRRDAIAGELAALRVPDLSLIAAPAPAPVRTLAAVAEAWRESRLDVADGTAATHRVNLSRILPRLGTSAVDAVTVADVAALVGAMHEGGLARESIRKTRATLAMVLDFAGVQPNPARDRSVKLPPKDRTEIAPPTAAHVEATLAAVPRLYRLPLLVLDATGMRVGELEALTWGDVDEYEGRWRVSGAVAKTGQARWVPVPQTLLQAVLEAVPREDRDLSASPFAGFTADRLRTAIARACKATGTPLYSPHDLRHRRATLWHLSGVPASQAAAWLGHSAQEHLRTYAHVMLDRTELDHASLLETCTDGVHSVLTRS